MFIIPFSLCPFPTQYHCEHDFVDLKANQNSSQTLSNCSQTVASMNNLHPASDGNAASTREQEPPHEDQMALPDHNSQTLMAPEMTDPTRLDLPAGLEQRTTPGGRVYFVDHHMHSTTWSHPLNPNLENGSVVVALDGPPLPSGWEANRKANGSVHFIDHNTRTTTWDGLR
ncbi:hypothetical protein B0O99DRAFT_613452 [Bisporella sp. PMI_857]|nr:hypothetical protein B0O99DRAFT_613452 [Bisporella sp. PMI_857]